MSRRWWIASGLLLAALGVVAVVLDRAASDRRTPGDLENYFGEVPPDIAPWDRTLTLTRPALVGVALVVLGLVLAVVVLARRWGADARLRAAQVSGGAVEETADLPIEDHVSPQAAEVADAVPATGSARGRATALVVAAGLVAAGVFVVLTNRLGDPVLANGGKGIAVLDNIAAVPSDDGPLSFGWDVATSGEPAWAALGLRADDAGLVDARPVAAFAWAAAVLGLLLVTGAVAYAVGRRRWTAALPVGALGVLVLAGGLVLAAISPPPSAAVVYWGAYTPLVGAPPSDVEARVYVPSTQETMPMPDVVGRTYADAEALLVELGIWNVQPPDAARTGPGGGYDGVVRRQSPTAGELVVPDDVVVVLDTRTR